MLRKWFSRPREHRLPEIKEIKVAQDVYIVAGDLQEYKMYKRVHKEYKDAVYVGSLGVILGARNAIIIFTGSYGKRSDSVDLWEYAQARGNTIIEDYVL